MHTKMPAQQPTPTMYNCKFPMGQVEDNLSPYIYITVAEDIWR